MKIACTSIFWSPRCKQRLPWIRLRFFHNRPTQVEDGKSENTPHFTCRLFLLRSIEMFVHHKKRLYLFANVLQRHWQGIYIDNAPIAVSISASGVCHCASYHGSVLIKWRWKPGARQKVVISQYRSCGINAPNTTAKMWRSESSVLYRASNELRSTVSKFSRKKYLANLNSVEKGSGTIDIRNASNSQITSTLKMRSMTEVYILRGDQDSGSHYTYYTI